MYAFVCVSVYCTFHLYLFLVISKNSFTEIPSVTFSVSGWVLWKHDSNYSLECNPWHWFPRLALDFRVLGIIFCGTCSACPPEKPWMLGTWAVPVLLVLSLCQGSLLMQNNLSPHISGRAATVCVSMWLTSLHVYRVRPTSVWCGLPLKFKNGIWNLLWKNPWCGLFMIGS